MSGVPVELDHVVLQRLDPEHVLHLEVVQLAVRPFGVDHVLAVLPVHARRDVEVRELDVVEIAQHRLGRGQVHRPVVVGPCPGFDFLAWHSAQLCRPTYVATASSGRQVHQSIKRISDTSSTKPAGTIQTVRRRRAGSSGRWRQACGDVPAGACSSSAFQSDGRPRAAHPRQGLPLILHTPLHAAQARSRIHPQRGGVGLTKAGWLSEPTSAGFKIIVSKSGTFS